MRRSRTRRPRCRSAFAVASLTLPLLLLSGCEKEAAKPEAALADSLYARITRPAEAGAVHLVRMVAHGDTYAFEPSEVRIRAGDVVRFVLTGTQPESVAFDTLQAPPDGAAFLREGALLHGVLLTTPGQVYEVSFRGAPPGRYAFRSIPHAAQGMRGVVEVVPPQ